MSRIIKITETLFLLEVPTYAIDLRISQDDITEPHYLNYKNVCDNYREGFDLPNLNRGNKYKIHAPIITPELSFDFEVDDSWVEIKKDSVFDNVDNYDLFENYLSSESICITKEESFSTRIQKAIKDEGLYLSNPKDKPYGYRKSDDYSEKKFDFDYSLWYEYESKTIKGNLILIDKIN